MVIAKVGPRPRGRWQALATVHGGGVVTRVPGSGALRVGRWKLLHQKVAEAAMSGWKPRCAVQPRLRLRWIAMAFRKRSLPQTMLQKCLTIWYDSLFCFLARLCIVDTICHEAVWFLVCTSDRFKYCLSLFPPLDALWKWKWK